MKHMNRRSFLGASLALGAASFFPAPAQIARGANERVRIGAIGLGVRGNEHIAAFRKMDDVDVVAISDPDSARVDASVKKHELSTVKRFADCREVIDDTNVDAVVITTCDHWHCLAAIWAMQAGKDVYVEKPLAHNVYEGIQACNAARKYKRICQVGMQQRSDKMQVEIKKFLHDEKSLGAIQMARVNHYMPRNPIGLRQEPLEFPATVDKNLWLGPAEDMPMYRNTLQYDWHWSFNTGTGEMGNWGVHVLDDCRNNVLLDAMEFPKRILGGGVRAGEKDGGETPNIHFVYFDSGTIPVVLALSTLAMKDSKSAGPHPGPGSGYIAYCEGGRLEGQRGSAKAFDAEGKLIKQWKGDSGQWDHQRDFIEAVKSQDNSNLKGEIAVGKATSEWCNLANIAFRCGKPITEERAATIARAATGAEKIWGEALESAQTTLQSHGVSMLDSEVVCSDMLTFDSETRQFVGVDSDKANSYLKRTYRNSEFTVPEIN